MVSVSSTRIFLHARVPTFVRLEQERRGDEKRRKKMTHAAQFSRESRLSEARKEKRERVISFAQENDRTAATKLNNRLSVATMFAVRDCYFVTSSAMWLDRIYLRLETRRVHD